MPPTVQKSNILAKLQGRLGGLAKKVGETPIEWGRGQDPPPGIRNGIAQLIDCRFDTYKSGDTLKGEPYWRASAVIIEPKTVIVDGAEIPCAGLQTALQIPIVDRKDASGKVTSRDVDQLYTAVDEMRKLMYPQEVDSKVVATEQGLVLLCEAVKKAGPQTADGKPSGPFFYFSTSKKQSREYIDAKTKEKKKSAEGVWQNWHGRKGLEDYVPSSNSDVTAGVEDNTGEAPAEEFNHADADGAVDEAAPETEGNELEQLLEAAKSKDTAAQAHLKQLASEAGMSDEDFGKASWDEVAVFLGGLSEDGDNDEEHSDTVEEPASEPTPSKGEVYVIDQVRKHPTTKKPVKVKIKVEVLTVDEASRTVTAREAATKKPISDANKKPVRFPFDALLTE